MKRFITSVVAMATLSALLSSQAHAQIQREERLVTPAGKSLAESGLLVKKTGYVVTYRTTRWVTVSSPLDSKEQSREKANRLASLGFYIRSRQGYVQAHTLTARERTFNSLSAAQDFQRSLRRLINDNSALVMSWELRR